MSVKKRSMNLIFPAPRTARAASIGGRFTILAGLAVTSFCAGGAAARSPISLDVLQRDGYGSVELIKSGQNKLYVPAEINGKKTRLLLDTGWGNDA